jgi:ribosomal protein S14
MPSTRSFTPTRQSNPCRICGDIKGNCRQTPADLNLCMAASGTLPGFRYLGQTKDGLWAKYILDDGLVQNQAERDRRWQEQQLLRQHRAAVEAQRHAQSLSATERDRLYRQLLTQLSLHPDDRSDLHRRGLTDHQIEAWGVRSVEQWQKLIIELPFTLPGVNLDGKSLNTPYPGYLCPIHDLAGLIVGFQIRTRQPKPGHPRYYWLTSRTKKRPNGATPHLPNGELPLAIHQPEQADNTSIALVEGTGAKPHLLAQRLNSVTIGAAGGQFAASSKLLQETLTQLSGQLQTQTILFYPDAGAVQNKNVLRQYRNTFKLLRQWGYSVEIGWWGQTDKRTHTDIDELEQLDQIRYLSVVQFEKIAAQHTGLIHQLQKLLTTLSRPTSPKPKGFSRTSQTLCRRLSRRRKPADVQEQARLLLLQANRDRRRFIHKHWLIPKPQKAPILEYQAGIRLQVWQNAIAAGYRYVLDISQPGTGKSFDSGRVTPESFDVRQVIYLSDQHRNPTVETLDQGWEDLEARHGGLSRVATPGGSRLQRSAKGEIPSVSANCSRNGVLNTLRDKNVSGADTANLICGTCILREACINADGPGYGYLNQRRHTLGAPLLRAHPDSLPDINDFSLEDVLLIWDEPGQNLRLKRSLIVTFQDLQQTLSALLGYPQLFSQIQPLLSGLLPLLDGSAKLGKFGFDFTHVKECLPSMEGVDASAISQALLPDLGFLNTTSEYGVDLADLPKEVRKRFSERDSQMAEQATGLVVKQWLPDLIEVLQGKPGSVHVGRQGMTLTLPDGRHQAMAQAAYGNLFLDSTLSREDLALKLGCAPEDIQVIRQSVPHRHNLKVTQVVDIGRAGMSRGNDQQKRVHALIDHFRQEDSSTKIIDFKRFAADGAWWRDSRGVNDFLEVKTLVLVGTPCRNLVDLASEYGIATGTYPCDDDPGFKAFVDRAIIAEIHQAIGRLRPHRRPIDLLSVILISNVQLDISVQQVKAQALSPEAASKTERIQLAIARAIQTLKSGGQKVTQQIVSALTAIPRGTIARYWSLFISLVSNINSKMNKSEINDEVMNQAIASVLEEVATASLEQLLPGLEEVFFHWIKPRQWRNVWECVSGQAQMAILSGLSLTIPQKSLQVVEQSKDELPLTVK